MTSKRFWNIPGTQTGMQPLHLARIEDLGHGDLVKVDCAACSHLALLTPEFLIRLALSLQAKVRELPFRCRGCGAKGRAVVSGGRGRSTSIRTLSRELMRGFLGADIIGMQ